MCASGCCMRRALASGGSWSSGGGGNGGGGCDCCCCCCWGGGGGGGRLDRGDGVAVVTGVAVPLPAWRWGSCRCEYAWEACECDDESGDGAAVDAPRVDADADADAGESCASGGVSTKVAVDVEAAVGAAVDAAVDAAGVGCTCLLAVSSDMMPSSFCSNWPTRLLVLVKINISSHEGKSPHVGFPRRGPRGLRVGNRHSAFMRAHLNC